MIVFAGDQHEDIDYAARVIEAATALGNSPVFFAGDGGIWRDLRWVTAVSDLACAANVQVFLVRGNHEDQEFVAEFALGSVTTLRPNVNFTADGAVLTVDGVRIGVFGGGVSVDAEHRTPGVDVFPGAELPSMAAVKLLERANVDVLVTHDAPILPPSMNKTFGSDDLVLSRARVAAAVDASQPKIVIHGHYHVRYDSSLHLASGVEVETHGLAANFSSLGDAVGVLHHGHWITLSQALYS